MKTKSKVYFAAAEKSDNAQSLAEKLEKLIESSRLFGFIKKGDRVAVKLHFGEEGNKGYVSPDYLSVINWMISLKEAKPFLSDTNTLYRGRRMKSSDHLQLAHQHGFTPEKVKAEVIIPDETQKENVKEIALNVKYIKTAKIAKIFFDADSIVGVAHFKGHIMTGFGGALKNIGMGCAVREGKLAQHSDIAPFVILKRCTGCEACIAACPAKAIELKDGKAVIDNSKCIGCARCIAACKYNAIELKWESGGDLIQEKMVEYVKAVLENKKGKAAFLNFCIKVTKECDCMAKDDPRVVPDIGILASHDPVALDKASLDLVNMAAGKDIIKELHPTRNCLKQLRHAEKLNLGTLNYELI
jgi:hypothetical protein